MTTERAPATALPRGALDGIRVLDVAQLVAGPLAAAYLADLGADVVKVEPPGGEKGRAMGREQLGDTATPAFLAVNRNKRSMILDLKTHAGREVLARLILQTNAVVTSYRPAVAKPLGLGYEDIRALNPAIVYCSITGYGNQGPLQHEPAVDYALQAQSGLIAINGLPDQPIKVALTVVDLTCAHLAAQGLLAALFHQLRSGQGQALSISLYDAAIALQAIPLTEYLHTGKQPKRTGNSATLGAPADLFETADGLLVVSAYFPKQWEALCGLLERPDLFQNPLFETNAARLRNYVALREELRPLFRGRQTVAWLPVLRQAGIIVAHVSDYQSLVNSDQMAANRMILHWDDPALGPLRTIGYPVKFTKTPATRRQSVPCPGEDTAAILQEMGVTDPQVNEWRARGAFGNQPTPSTAVHSV